MDIVLNPQDKITACPLEAAEGLSVQDRRLTLQNLEKLAVNLQTQVEKAKQIINNGGGDEHTTVYLKLEGHLSKIKKFTGQTMLLKLCDINSVDMKPDQ